MKPRNAHLLDDLIHKRPGGQLYKHVRDGHTADLAEIVGALESLIEPSDQDPIIHALLSYAWILLEARPPHGSDEARQRDKARDKTLAELKIETRPKRRAR